MPPEAIPEAVKNFIAGSSHANERKKIIAFYGGSFTGLDNTLLEKYLNTALSLKNQGVVDSIKASTRPDMISQPILDKLIHAGFEELELGAQSMDDKVLNASKRGHTSIDTIKAASLIKESGLKLGLQIMPGLPGEDRDSFKHTIDAIVALKPDTVRIYPTVVIQGTALEDMYKKGKYQPLDLDEAVRRSLYAFIRFRQCNANILRIGIPIAGNINIVAGPTHPSFGFLVRAKAYCFMAKSAIDSYGPETIMHVNPKNLSELLGLKREALHELNFSYQSDPSVEEDSITIKSHSGHACLYFKDIIEHVL
jgi:histone acetyltransferase (RNA polymerase elongator complex component)